MESIIGWFLLAGLLIWGAVYCVAYLIFGIVGELGEHYRGACGCYRDRNGVYVEYANQFMDRHGSHFPLGEIEFVIRPLSASTTIR